MQNNLTPEQQKGIEEHNKEFEKRCERVASLHGISTARQKAIDFVLQRKKEKEIREKFLNPDKNNEKPNT
jgi:hypothetical protein